MSPEEPQRALRPAFAVKDCALTALATGVRVENLKELRDGLLEVPAGSIYQHFWGRLLQPRFDEPEYNNDFASWAYHALHEKPLAERLSVVDPAGFEDLEALRRELVEVVEQRLDEGGMVPWATADEHFHFIQSQIVVFDTGIMIHDPADLPAIVPGLSTGSIFYHFIDARRRTPDRRDDFSVWLSGFGAECQPVIDRLGRLDPYFSSLKGIQRMLAQVCLDHCSEGGGQEVVV